MKKNPNAMVRRLGRYLIFILIGCILAWILAKREMNPSIKGEPRDYAEIVAEGVLHVTSEYGALGMLAKGDTVSGLHFELVNAFAQAHQLKLSIVPQTDFSLQLEGLDRGKYDLIAAGIPVTTAMRDTLLLSQPLLINRQLLVQRKPTTAEDSARYITSQIELAHQELHVAKESPALMRIHHLSNEIGDTIYVKQMERYGAEQLLYMVAHGDIDYAVCDAQTVEAVIDSLPQLDVHLAIGFTQFYAWGASKKSQALMDSINTWLTIYLKSAKGRALYRKYQQTLPSLKK